MRKLPRWTGAIAAPLIACTSLGGGTGLPGGDYRPIEIEILANRADNEIDVSNINGTIDVTILGSLNFSVLQIDGGTVRVAGAMPNSMHGRSVDYNSDRNRDYEYTVAIGKMNIDRATTSICLTGALTDGTRFRGCAPVTISKR